MLGAHDWAVTLHLDSVGNDGYTYSMLNLDSIQDVIVADLSATAIHAARSVSGGGSEKWLAGESRIAIMWANLAVIPVGQWVELELCITPNQRADLVVVEMDAAQANRLYPAISEFKAVENKSDSYVDGLIAELVTQLQGHHQHHANAQTFGVVFAVWQNETARRTTDPHGSIETFDEFKHRLADRIRAAGLKITPAGFKTIFDKFGTGAAPRAPTNMLRSLAVAMVEL